MKILKNNPAGKLIKYKIFHKYFSIKRDYQRLEIFTPEDESSKFYKNYFKPMSQNELETMKYDKLEYINNIIKKDRSISSTFNKIQTNVNASLDLKDVLKIIHNITETEEKNLQELSEYYFKAEGKRIRIYILIMISKYIFECKYKNGENYFNSLEHKNYVKLFAATVEILHNGSLLHDDIIDNSDKRRNSPTAHKVYGIKNTVYSAKFIISKAASLISELDKGQLNEIYSAMVNNLTYGEVQQSLRNPDLDNIDSAFFVYMIKTYYKTASLISLSLRGVGIIYDLDHTLQRDLFNVGLHIGLVFQLIDDVIDVQYDSNQIKKPAFKDIQEGIINSYILYEIADENEEVLQMAERKFKNQGDIERIKFIIRDGCGVLKTENLALDHLIEAFKILNNNPFFVENNTKTILMEYFNKLIYRKY
jgi:geranylgeranyl pyrophosphate synthase